jgi:hypothetical protein
VRSVQRRLEVSRFDHCRLVARAVADDVQPAVSALEEPKLPSSVEVGGGGSRRFTIAGGVLLGVGVLTTAVGIYFGALMSSRSDISRGCSAMPCTVDMLIARDADYRDARTATAVTLSIGAASLITGAVLLAVGSRHSHARQLACNGSGCAWRF